jgi:hypothetical protein
LFRFSKAAIWVTNYENEFHALYRNVSVPNRVHFVFATPASGIGAIGQKFVGWGTGFADFDRYGWEDLFIANGHAITAVGVGVRIAGNVIVGVGIRNNSQGGVIAYADNAAVGKNAFVIENNDISNVNTAIYATGERGHPSHGGSGGAEVSVRHNLVHDNYFGITLRRATAIENVVYGNEIAGIQALGAVAGPAGSFAAPSDIIGNYVYANRGDGILALLGATAARTGGAPAGVAAARVTFWGALAMGATAGVGALVGRVL